jgi:RNA polymerase sigma-70 factor (ECF subfamily)
VILAAGAKHSPDNRPLESHPELIRRILAGDRHAVAVLYERYLPSIWRYVCARLRGDEAGCRDVVSDTFLDAVRSARSFDGQAGSVPGWLTGIARHKIVDYRRTRSRAPGELVADPLAEGADPAVQSAAEESRESQPC